MFGFSPTNVSATEVKNNEISHNSLCNDATVSEQDSSVNCFVDVSKVYSELYNKPEYVSYPSPCVECDYYNNPTEVTRLDEYQVRQLYTVGFVPSKPLVCVELNPGPPKKTMVAVSVTGQSSQNQKKKNKQVKKNKSKNRKKSVNEGRITLGQYTGLNRGAKLGNYLKCLKDPFENSPVRLGFGCMTTSNLATAYVRSTFTVNADGTFACFLFPANSTTGGGGSRGGLYINTSGSAGLTWSAVPFTNNIGITLQGNESRIIGAGLRILPRQALTAQSGLIYTANIPTATYDQMAGFSPLGVSQHPLANWSDGLQGTQSVVMPCDLDAFTFFSVVQLGYPNSTLSFSSIPVMSGSGFPVGAVIAYEAVCHFEILPSANTISTSYTPQGYNKIDPGLTDEVSSIDKLWRVAADFVSNPSTYTAMFDTAIGLGKTYSTIYGQGKGFRLHDDL